MNAAIQDESGTGFLFTGPSADYDYLKKWLSDKCVPLVREITFENAEEMTEEGIPFLILFRYAILSKSRV